jgi:nucleotide-binding universal stress UspA family protein
MFRKILVAYDGSVDGKAALAKAVDLAAAGHAEVMLLAVVDVGMELALAQGVAAGGPFEEQFREASDLLAAAAANIAAKGITATTRVAAGHAGERIASLARETGADLIVLGHRHHGFWSRFMQEPVGPFLLGDPPCSLLVCA